MNFPAYVWFALATGLFWGLYGPALGEARPFLSNPFQSYVPIGVAYFFCAIVGGIAILKYLGQPIIPAIPGLSPIPGLSASFIAGTLGALGALALTLAMFNGGAKHPHTVMPVVFGTAVTVTALVTVGKALWTGKGEVGSPIMWLGILGMFVSLLLITMNTPHTAPAKPIGARRASLFSPRPVVILSRP